MTFLGHFRVIFQVDKHPCRRFGAFGPCWEAPAAPWGVSGGSLEYPQGVPRGSRRRPERPRASPVLYQELPWEPMFEKEWFYCSGKHIFNEAAGFHPSAELAEPGRWGGVEGG